MRIRLILLERTEISSGSLCPFSVLKKQFPLFVVKSVFYLRKFLVFFAISCHAIHDNSVLIFDEVQEVPRTSASLRYFYENAPQYRISVRTSMPDYKKEGGLVDLPLYAIDRIAEISV